jgi:hypothetical protein
METRRRLFIFSDAACNRRWLFHFHAPGMGLNFMGKNIFTIFPPFLFVPLTLFQNQLKPWEIVEWFHSLETEVYL